MSRRAATRTLATFSAIWCLAAGLSASRQPADSRLGQAPTALPIVKRTSLSDGDIETFLLKGSVGKSRGAGKGITGSLRAVVTDGTLTHDVHIQTIDEAKREFRSSQGTEFNFRDSWTFNIAAYKIDRLIGLGLVPVSVSRRYKGQMAAFTWWIDDVQMDESERLKRKISPPDLERWNQQMQMLRLFDQLIGNVDRNLGNLLVGKTWDIWAIDHTRAFRTQTFLKTPGNIARCDREVLARLRALDKTTVRDAVGNHLQVFEIESLLKRRDAIVAIIDQRGDAGLFDRLP